MSEDLAEGARNLLINCAELKINESLVIVCESAELGWYDETAPDAVAAAARNMGVEPVILKVGAPENERDPRIIEAMADHDCTVFFARIGDQDRFAEPVPGKKTVMSYARTAQQLTSLFGRADHRAFIQLKQAVNDILLGANIIRITCPQGSDVSGNVSGSEREDLGDVSVRRFPLGVPQPLDAGGMSGRVALSRYLTPTGSKIYDPPSVPIDGVVMAEVSDGRILDLQGEQASVRRIRQHYEMVSDKFGIEKDIVHSFHAGIHPGSTFTQDAAVDPDLWSNSVFTNPRVLHFHTCGDYIPGEISWMLIDHTLSVDGIDLWHKGCLCPEVFKETQTCLESWPELRTLIASPSQAIGI